MTRRVLKTAFTHHDAATAPFSELIHALHPLQSESTVPGVGRRPPRRMDMTNC